MKYILKFLRMKNMNKNNKVDEKAGRIEDYPLTLAPSIVSNGFAIKPTKVIPSSSHIHLIFVIILY